MEATALLYRRFRRPIFRRRCSSARTYPHAKNSVLYRNGPSRCITGNRNCDWPICFIRCCSSLWRLKKPHTTEYFKVNA